jgi:adenine deaminase
MEHRKVGTPNRFAAQPVSEEDLRLPLGGPSMQVMVVDDGQIVTRRAWAEVQQAGPWLEPDTERDLLLLAVINRYEPAASGPGRGAGFWPEARSPGLNGGPRQPQHHRRGR